MTSWTFTNLVSWGPGVLEEKKQPLPGKSLLTGRDACKMLKGPFVGVSSKSGIQQVAASQDNKNKLS